MKNEVSVLSKMSEVLKSNFIDEVKDFSDIDSPIQMKRIRIKFKNGLSLSIVQGPYSYGGKEGLFEIAVMNKDGITAEFFDAEDETDDVLGYCSVEKVTHYILKIGSLK